MKRKEMLNKYTTNLERKGGSLSCEKKKLGGGWIEESGYGRVQAAKVSQRKKSPLLKKTKCFHTCCKCIRLSKSKGRLEEEERNGVWNTRGWWVPGRFPW